MSNIGMGNPPEQQARESFGLRAWFVTLVLLTFWRYLPLGFTDHDSMDTAIHYWHDPVWAWLNEVAEHSGRFSILPAGVASLYPYLSTSGLWLKICGVGSLLGTVGLFHLALRRVTKNRDFAMLSTVLFLAVANHSINHSLFTGYFSFQLWAMAVLGCLIVFDRSLTGGGRLSYGFAVLLWGASLFLAAEEDRFLYGAFLLLIAWNCSREERPLQTIRFLARTTWPFAAAVLLFGAVTLVYRLQHPSQYAGNQLSLQSFSLVNYAKALWTYTVSAAPGYIFFDPVYEKMFRYFSDNGSGLPGLWRSLRVEWLVRSVAVAVLVAASVRRIGPASKRSVMLLLLAGFIALVLPQAGICLSAHYQQKALSGERVMTHFSFFAALGVGMLAASLAVGCAWLGRRFRHPIFAIAVTGILSGAAGFASLIADYGNHYVARFDEISAGKFDAVRLLARADAFRSLPESAIIAAPSLWRPPYSPGYYQITDFSGSHLVAPHRDEQNFWEKYLEVFSGKRVTVIRSLSDRRLDDIGFYYLNYVQGFKDPKRFVSLARVTSMDDEHLYADSLVLFSQASNRVFRVYFKTKEPTTVSFKIDGEKHAAEDGHASFVVNRLATSDALIPIRIEGPEIDLDSLDISYFDRREHGVAVEALANPSFEAWITDGLPENWKVNGAVSPADDAREGERALTLGLPVDGKNVTAQQQLSDGDLLIGRRVRAQIQAKSSEAGKLGFNFYYSVGGVRKSFSTSHSGSGEWETLSHEVDVPSDADPASLYCLVTHRAGATNSALVDDVRVWVSP